ncbi:hypothetical protein, partial [Pseudomonas sp. NCHU5232]|uniref:hypothetical protein n=1 Tax=Pseudomonas sp. NCHU5232 TaxID=3451356 RepID=UPI003F956BAB
GETGDISRTPISSLNTENNTQTCQSDINPDFPMIPRRSFFFRRCRTSNAAAPVIARRKGDALVIASIGCDHRALSNR